MLLPRPNYARTTGRPTRRLLLKAFESFGFASARKAGKQYRRGETEMACSAPFETVWSSVVKSSRFWHRSSSSVVIRSTTKIWDFSPVTELAASP